MRIVNYILKHYLNLITSCHKALLPLLWDKHFKRIKLNPYYKMKKITSPNLFNWATKELSQDAFICWVSEWSNPYLKEKNSYMNSVGKEFITQLLNKHSIIYTDLHSVEVFKQKFNIDIVLKIDIDDKKYVLVIEDKTHALDYNPLDEYIKSISKDEDFENYIPLGLFIKTGDQASYLNVTSKSYALFLRNDFISFFEKIASIEGHNDILNDFRKRLIYSHNSVNSFASLKIKDWHWDSWKGFYNFIQKETKFKDWKYVSNPSGGFLCSNWPWNKICLAGMMIIKYIYRLNKEICVLNWVRFTETIRIKKKYAIGGIQ